MYPFQSRELCFELLRIGDRLATNYGLQSGCSLLELVFSLTCRALAGQLSQVKVTGFLIKNLGKALGSVDSLHVHMGEVVIVNREFAIPDLLFSNHGAGFEQIQRVSDWHPEEQSGMELVLEIIYHSIEVVVLHDLGLVCPENQESKTLYKDQRSNSNIHRY